MVQLVAVYGTLKMGFGNHRLLAKSIYKGQDLIFGFDMYNLGYFPGVKKSKEHSHCVEVEVYEVSDKAMASLDCLEGYHPNAPTEGLYDRTRVTSRWGRPWLYVYNGSVDGHEHIINNDNIGVWQ